MVRLNLNLIRVNFIFAHVLFGFSFFKFGIICNCILLPISKTLNALTLNYQTNTFIKKYLSLGMGTIYIHALLK